MPNISTKPTQLPEEIGMYVDALRQARPEIDEVWLMGPRVNADESRGAVWDLLLFANRRALETLRSDAQWRRPDVDLFVVVDGDHFESAWGAAAAGTLKDLDWRLEEPHAATYIDKRSPVRSDAGGDRATAVRVR